jgi:hypothetical protein
VQERPSRNERKAKFIKKKIFDEIFENVHFCGSLSSAESNNPQVLLIRRMGNGQNKIQKFVKMFKIWLELNEKLNFKILGKLVSC